MLFHSVQVAAMPARGHAILYTGYRTTGSSTSRELEREQRRSGPGRRGGRGSAHRGIANILTHSLKTLSLQTKLRNGLGQRPKLKNFLGVHQNRAQF
jgi:hypothetical protein